MTTEMDKKTQLADFVNDKEVYDQEIRNRNGEKIYLLDLMQQYADKQSENIGVLANVMPSLFKERRLSISLSMQDVTDKTDISKATISRIERGSDAFFDTVMKLDKFYTENGA